MNHIAVRLLLASICAILGVAGLILPILPGWIFFAIVVLLLFPEAPLTRRSVERLERHFPSVRRVMGWFVPRAATPSERGKAAQS